MIEIRPRSDEAAGLGNAVVVESGDDWMDVKPTGPCPGGIPKLKDIVNVQDPKFEYFYLELWYVSTINRMSNTYTLRRGHNSGIINFLPGEPIQLSILASTTREA